MKYDYNTFKELFDSHIHYAYEGQYGVHKHESNGTKAITFHKLTVWEHGHLEYKGHWETYDPRLWPKVKALAKLLTETKAEKILFKKKQGEIND